MTDLVVSTPSVFNPAIIGSSRNTMTLASEDERFEFLKAISDPLSGDEFVGKPFNLINVVQVVVEFANDVTGELEPTVQNVLVTDIGTFQVFSSTAARDIDRILTIMGAPSAINKKFKFVLKTEKSKKNAGKYFTIKAA